MRYLATCLLIAMTSVVAGADTDVNYRIEFQIVELPSGDHSGQPAVAWDEWALIKGAKVLSSPTMILRANTRGQIGIGASQQLSYLHRSSDGRFELRKQDAGDVGLSIDVEIVGPQVKIDFESVSVSGGSDGEIDVLGIAVPIGKPKLQRDRKSFAMMFQPEPTKSVLVMSTDHRDVHLVVRVRSQLSSGATGRN